MSVAARGVPQLSAEAAEVAGLLRRYPDLAPAETARLIRRFRALPIQDVAVIATDEQLRPRLDAFRRGCRGAFGAPLRHDPVSAIPGALILAAAWGLWSAAMGG